MPKFGAHMSISGGFHLAIDRGEAVGCDTIQIFTKSNRQWAAAPIADEDAAAFIARRAESSIDPVFVHASYLINVCSEVDATREKSVMGLIDEIDRAAKLELPFIVLHPGSPKGGVSSKLTSLALRSRGGIRPSGSNFTSTTLALNPIVKPCLSTCRGSAAVASSVTGSM